VSLIRQTKRKRKKKEKKKREGEREKKAIEIKKQKRVRKTSTRRAMRSRRSIKSSIDSAPFCKRRDSLARSLAYRAPHARQFSTKRRKKGRKVHTTGKRHRRSRVAASHVSGCWIFYADDALAHLSIVYISSTRVDDLEILRSRTLRTDIAKNFTQLSHIKYLISNKFKSIRAGNCCFRKE